jgi:cyclin A
VFEIRVFGWWVLNLGLFLMMGLNFFFLLIQMEQKRRPMPEYIERVQKDITANMRGVLVDWLVEVAEEYKLLPDTLYLCISYVDRFLSLNVVSKQRLQLLGVSSMLIAS